MRFSLPVVDMDAEYEKKEKCGIFGVWGTSLASQLAYVGIFAQQHRGQESAGIAVTDGKKIKAHVGMGLVSQVFNPRQLKEELAGNGAIGHVRYSTTGSSSLSNAQPLLRQYRNGQVALGHNGNLVNAGGLRLDFESKGHIFQSTTDTEVIVHLLAKPAQLEQADPLPDVLRQLQGAFSLVFLFPNRIEAARDPWGIRPLSIGRMPDGAWCVASETCAFDAMGAEYIRDVEPGEIVTLDDNGMRSRTYAEPAMYGARCVFEQVYFANPASNVFGQTVQRTREEMGRQLAREAWVDADCVIPMPDSGRTAALGYSKESNIPFLEAIVPNRFVGRTFILPDQAARDRAVNLKLNIITELVRGKRLVVVDDSIVRGTTTRSKMRALRRAGAKEIHLRISCPPIRHPCYYGIDFASPTELIAHERTIDQIRDFIEVDSLSYLSLNGMLRCSGVPEKDCCTACWTGQYKIPFETGSDPLSASSKCD